MCLSCTYVYVSKVSQRFSYTNEYAFLNGKFPSIHTYSTVSLYIFTKIKAKTKILYTCVCSIYACDG